MQKEIITTSAKMAPIHHLILEERKKITITAVLKVHSCDENMAIMETTNGRLHIEGKNLAMSELSLQSAEVCVQGDIIAISYTENKESAKGFLRHFLR